MHASHKPAGYMDYFYYMSLEVTLSDETHSNQ